MRFFYKFILVIAFSAAGPALSQTKTQTSQLYSVGTQSVQLKTAYHLDRECKPIGITRMAVIDAPKHGTLTDQSIELFTTFSDSNPNKHCNERKSPAIGVYYAAKDGFKGKDNFSFVLVFSDGESWRYNIKMTVW